MPLDIGVVADGGGSRLPLGLGFQCPCECPMPGAAWPTALRRVAAGETFEVTWDARSVVTWYDSVLCNDWAPLPPRRASVVKGVLQPVDPGRFWIAIGFESTLPAICHGAGPEYACDISYTTNSTSSIAPRCETSTVATAEFTLPASGDVAVPVAIN
jgi:hypothetical protein